MWIQGLWLLRISATRPAEGSHLHFLCKTMNTSNIGFARKRKALRNSNVLQILKSWIPIQYFSLRKFRTVELFEMRWLMWKYSNFSAAHRLLCDVDTSYSNNLRLFNGGSGSFFSFFFIQNYCECTWHLTMAELRIFFVNYQSLSRKASLMKFSDCKALMLSSGVDYVFMPSPWCWRDVDTSVFLLPPTPQARKIQPRVTIDLHKMEPEAEAVKMMTIKSCLGHVLNLVEFFND